VGNGGLYEFIQKTGDFETTFFSDLPLRSGDLLGCEIHVERGESGSIKIATTHDAGLFEIQM